MKRTSILMLAILFALSFILGGCNTGSDFDNTTQTPDDISQNIDNPDVDSLIEIETAERVTVSDDRGDTDILNISRIDIPERIPVSTESIREVLLETGRFDFGSIILPDGNEDFLFWLDNAGTGSAASLFFSVLPETSTDIISYNFSKAVVNGDEGEDIRWGLSVLLQILGTELSDEMWSDIFEIASSPEHIDSMGYDYAGYASEALGIRLIYADLGDNVQIDILPY